MNSTTTKFAWDRKHRVENIDLIGKDVFEAMSFRLNSEAAEASRWEIEQALTKLLMFLAYANKYPKLREAIIDGLSKCVQEGMRNSTVLLLGSMIDDLDMLVDDLLEYKKNPNYFKSKYSSDHTLHLRKNT